MAYIAHTSPLSPMRNTLPPREATLPRLSGRMALGAIVLLSIFMDFFLLGQNGYGNLYYAAGVKSMGDSLHNFFFVSLDPGGFVTVDKPPIGFWLQTLSTKICGFTAFSIFLPQALCGVLAVVLLYYLVSRHFGVVAGLVAALVLAVTPISVVTDRNNTIDGTLALVLLLAAWAVIHAAETGKLRWLLLSAVFVGLGFNIKMAEAYLVVPALVLTYLFCAPRTIWTRVWHLLLALLVMFVVSLSWAAAVDLTPATQRPYVGSTQNNSELSLAFGYNGLNRLHLGFLGGNGAGSRNRTGAGNATTTNTGSSAGKGVTTATSGNTLTAAARAIEEELGAGGSSQAGPLRLFSASLGGQIAWLLPFAILGIVALAWQRRFNFQRDRQQLGLILWGFWLLTMAIFFTLDGSFHQYYMTEMAPGLAALVGIGLVIMWQDYRRAGWRGWLLPFALIVTAAAQIYMLMSYPAWSSWLSPLIIMLTALAVLALILFRFRLRLYPDEVALRVAGTAVSVGMLGLLIAPALWAGYLVIHNTESSFPTAGPPAQGGQGAASAGFAFAGGGFPGTYGGNEGGRNANRGDRTGRTRGQNAFAGFAGAFGGGSAQANPALVRYLEANQGSAKFLVATPSASAAEPFILSTNKPVMAMGGFSGNDPILTTSSLQTLINDGIVRFFLLNAAGTTGRAAGRKGGQQSSLSSWVSAHCKAVPTSDWHPSAKSTGTGSSRLYDCASARS